ncbi:hypothetical protein AYO41_00870 [Verrucomicrobia bacterium SCGC AG-212-E04]|nr:hypothetical protein AYO41_00870 [Verrucomicrobia bacterium SCGC AG-212-E04]
MSEPLAFGHYRVARLPDGAPVELGRGAMGITYKAYNERLHIHVALKVIAPAQVGDRHAQALFLREARAAARIRHSNVASVLDLDDTPGRIFYAMEYIDGQSLKAWLPEHRPVAPLLAINLALQVARALEAIHEQGIVHRDLKPSNIMLLSTQGSSLDLARASDTSAEGWRVKIIDFGIARASGSHTQTDDTTTQTRGFRGTALYASPEQCAEHENVDGRADLYSLGCVLWEMLCGTPPFTAKTQRELINQHVSDTPPLDRLANLPSSVAAVVAKLLMKDPAARYPSASATVKALEECRAKLESGEDSVAGHGLSSFAATGSPSAQPAPAPSTTFNRATSTKRRLLPAALAALALAVAGWFAFRPQKPNPSQTPAQPSKTIAPAVQPSVAPAPTPALAISRKSIAVLPFENLSPDKENEYFADGVQDDVLTSLARIPDLKVISRTSVMEYRGHKKNVRKIADELGAATIVQGTVRRFRDSIRITVQLIDASTDEHLWAEKYERPIADIFAVQSEIAEAIAQKLAAQLTADDRAAMAEPPTRDIIAYEYYLKARAILLDLDYTHVWVAQESERNKATELLEKAVARDPGFYDAWFLLAAGGLPANSINAISVVQRLRPDAGQTHMVLGDQNRNRGNYEESAREYRLAANLLPNDGLIHRKLGDALCLLGDWDGAVQEYQRAIAIDPRNARSLSFLGTLLHQLRRYEDARSYLQRARLLAPDAVVLQVEMAMLDFDQYGDLSQAKQLVARLLRDEPRQISDDDNIGVYALFVALSSRDPGFAREVLEAVSQSGLKALRDYVQGRIALQAGDAKAAAIAFSTTLNEIDDPVFREIQWSPEGIQAEVLAYLGEQSKALDLGRRAFESAKPNDGDPLERYAATLLIFGERDKALRILSYAANKSNGPTFGSLCFDARWDPLRGDPRFESLVKQLAPKDGKTASPAPNSRN